MSILTIAAVAAILGASDIGGGIPFGGLSGGSVRIIESGHRIEFPNRILFRLRAEAPADVRSVRLFYRIGSHRASVYTYPTRMTAAPNLSAEFVVRTASGGFIPQGVDIEYHYVFTDSAGAQTESARFSFEYLDPRYDWQRLEMEDYVLLWHDMSQRAVRSVASDVSIRLRRVKALFGLDGDYRFKAVLVNGRAEAYRSFPPVSQTSQDTALYGGFAFGEFGALTLAGLDADGLTHELVHLMLDEAVDSPRARVPAWLNEGLAMYFERNSRLGEDAVRSALRRGRLIPLRNMGAVPGRPEDVRLFYSQSASVVRFMLDEQGEAAMRSLLAQIDRGRSIDAALRESHGMGVDQLDSAWRRRLSESRYASAVVDPGTAATSAIVGGAALTTASALGVRWLRQRYGAKKDEA